MGSATFKAPGEAGSKVPCLRCHGPCPSLEAPGWPQGPPVSPGMGWLGTPHGAALGRQDWCQHGAAPGSGWDLGCGIPAARRDALSTGQEPLPVSSAPGDGVRRSSRLLRNNPSDCDLCDISPSTQENQRLSSQPPCRQSTACPGSPWSTSSPRVPSQSHAAQPRSFHGRLSPGSAVQGPICHGLPSLKASSP